MAQKAKGAKGSKATKGATKTNVKPVINAGGKQQLLAVKAIAALILKGCRVTNLKGSNLRAKAMAKRADQTHVRPCIVYAKAA